ncbi:Piso0_004586 [Millerozyma farinosa CBS 7064]|uniref:Piso0_004586 protein n=1 Tax=Pichia sorbitophila (strain ATCC MYA-4447 / BCRC 22081 / CBS 7064 / NBRC 10061 / NRRL Y-12695) TaxID=559304 RepID=G8Y974_PICSO|nr:Piso0_004586 [Millerozyma farinosa CBS 7064]CCE85019.1 Piso0_004586 [Millerozyma farinosa CBS 7064]
MQGNDDNSLMERKSWLFSEITALIGNIKYAFKDRAVWKDAEMGKVMDDLESYINEFEVSPKLLDAKLSSWISDLCESYVGVMDNSGWSGNGNMLSRDISRIIYAFAKVRGMKVVYTYFNMDIYIAPELLSRVQAPALDHFEYFLLLLWLSNIVLNPFSLSTIQPEFPEQILKISYYHLENSPMGSKCQRVASLLLARLLSRPDFIQSGYLQNHFDTLVRELNSSNFYNPSFKLGHLMVINSLFKTASFSSTRPYFDLIYNEVLSADILAMKASNLTVHFDKDNVCFILKILKNLAVISVRRTERPNYLAIENIFNTLYHDIFLSNISNIDTVLREELAKTISKIIVSLDETAQNYKDQLIFYLMSQLYDLEPYSEKESVLKEKAVTANLSSELFVINSDKVSWNKCHMILLVLGYVSLLKSFPRKYIPFLLTISHNTIYFTKMRLNSSLGTQIRDSSCFILWALVRSLERSDIITIMRENPFMLETLVFDLISVVIFDDDLTIRRCGISVLQEIAGRFGTIIFDFSESKNEDPEKKGEFIVSFVEAISSKPSSLTGRFSLVYQLAEIGFDPSLFIPTLLKTINDKNSNFEKRDIAIEILDFCCKYSVSKKLLTFKLERQQEKHDIRSIANHFKTHIPHDWDNLFIYSRLIYLNKFDSGEEFYKIQSYLKHALERDDFKGDKNKTLSLMSWVKTCASHLESLDENNFWFLWPRMIDLFHTNGEQILSETLRGIFSLLSSRGVKIPSEIVHELVCILNSGDLNVASNIFYYHLLDSKHFDEIFLAMKNMENVDYLTRQNLIQCFNENIRNFKIEDKHISILLTLLDDYTTNMRGDVGSKIRLATMELLDNHADYFKAKRKELLPRLIRISGESMDILRKKALVLIFRFEPHDVTEQSDHFEKLFAFYKSNILTQFETGLQADAEIRSSHFWKGVVFTIGSPATTTSLFNESFKSLVQFLSSLDKSQLSKVFLEILRLIELPKDFKWSQLGFREQKKYLFSLNFLVHLFEANISFPNSFDYNTLYIRCYNLHINTSSESRVTPVLKIFSYLCTKDIDTTLRLKTLKRLCWISCCHKNSVFRHKAAENLFQIASNYTGSSFILHYIDGVDWSKNPTQLKNIHTQLESSFFNLVEYSCPQ